MFKTCSVTQNLQNKLSEENNKSANHYLVSHFISTPMLALNVESNWDQTHLNELFAFYDKM